MLQNVPMMDLQILLPLYSPFLLSRAQVTPLPARRRRANFRPHIKKPPGGGSAGGIYSLSKKLSEIVRMAPASFSSLDPIERADAHLFWLLTTL